MSIPAAIVALEPLEYASAGPSLSPDFAAVARRSFHLSVLCGLCVAVCFLPLAWPSPLASAAHLIIFAWTIATALRCGSALRRFDSLPVGSPRFLAECAALLGLAIFGVAPLITDQWKHEQTIAQVMIFAFGPLAATTARHVPFYRMLARYSRLMNCRRLAKSLIGLGWFKTFYEGLWLGSCFIGVFSIAMERNSAIGRYWGEDFKLFFAFGGLFGCFGFAGVWLWMMIAHGLLAAAARRSLKANSEDQRL